MHVAYGRTDLCVVVGGEILHQKVDQATVPLEDREHLGGAIAGIGRRWLCGRRRGRRRRDSRRGPDECGDDVLRQLTAADDGEPGAECKRKTFSERDHPLIVSRLSRKPLPRGSEKEEYRSLRCSSRLSPSC